MALLIIRHKAKDFAAWKRAYDADAGRRAEAGLTNGRVTRSIDDPNEIILLFDISDIDKAKNLAASPGLKDAMQGAGIIDKPDIYFVNDAG